jgi:DNA-binding MarR family transcriptional regulator
VQDPANESIERRVLHDFGYFGYFLHVHAGGRAGKQHILTWLLRNGSHLTQRELKEHAGTAAASLSEVLSKLEAKGLIERTPLESDRRQLDVRLTENGIARAIEIEAKKHEFEVNSLTPLSDSEKVQLAEMLDRVVAYWKTIEGKEEIPPCQQALKN